MILPTRSNCTFEQYSALRFGGIERPLPSFDVRLKTQNSDGPDYFAAAGGGMGSRVGESRGAARRYCAG
jgi:hypothetical protein